MPMSEYDAPADAPVSTTESAPPPIDERSRKSAMGIVFLVVFIDLLGFGIVLPLLPLYVFHLLRPVFGDQPRMIGPVLGVLMASFSFMQFIFAPVWGRISDRIGRRPVLLIGLAGSVTFYGLFGYASHIGFEGQAGLALVLILISRIGAGLAGATISTAQAVIADCTPAHKRSHGMAMIGAAFGIGFTFGPLLAWTSELFPSNAAPGAAAAGFSLIALVLAILLLPETLRGGARSGRRDWLHFGNTIKVLRLPTIGVLVLTFFLATLAFGSLESTLALMNQYLLTGGEKVVRMEDMTEGQFKAIIQKSLLIFAFVGLVLMLVQGLIYRRLVSRVGERRMLRAGVALMLVGLAGVIVVVLLVARQSLGGLGSVIPLALAILAVLVTGFAFMTPSVSSLISKSADPVRQGEVLGVNQSMSALARIIGPAAASTLFFLDDTHVWPYAVGMALMAVVLAITFRLQESAPAV
jgi:MFS family permease